MSYNGNLLVENRNGLIVDAPAREECAWETGRASACARRLAKMASKHSHVLQVFASCDLGIVATLEFLQHHLA